MVSLRVVQTPFILFSKSISERGGSDIERRWIQIIDRRCTSDPTLSDIDFKNKVAWVWITLKNVSVVNLDPAAEYFAYNPDVDIRELISIEDVMEDEDLRLGPNGGLVFCMEHLVENFDWLEEAMDPHDDDYFLIGRAT